MMDTSGSHGKWLHTPNLTQIQMFVTHLGSEELCFILIAKFDEADESGGSSLYQSVISNVCICSVCVWCMFVCVCVCVCVCVLSLIHI